MEGVSINNVRNNSLDLIGPAEKNRDNEKKKGGKNST